MRVALPLLLTLALPAHADSPDAWEAFRAGVRAACAAALADAGWPEADAIEVNPFGSQSYGVALIDAGGDRLACIVDKATDTAEVTGAFTPAEAPADGAAEADPDLTTAP